MNEQRDKDDIREIVDEIDNACDLKEWERLLTYFAANVNVDFVSLAGGGPAKVSAEDLVGAWRKNLYAEKKTFHQRGNHSITVNGDQATAFSKGYAFNLIEKGEVTGLWEVWGNYTHTLIRTENGWKVNGMKLDVIHQRGDARVRSYIPE